MANKKITDLMSGTPVRDSLLESAIDISGTMDSRKVKAGVIADLASANVAAPYDSTVTYAIGQYCLYEGDIYRCIAITTGAFDSTAWVQIVVTGEFRRVVELTSAQYTALSSAEKNNGTLYIITDEETTAADIPYSSGVSVADKLDSLSNVSQITAITNDATGISDNDTLIVRYGNLIIMSISFTLSQSYADQWKNVFSFDDTSLSIAGIAGYIGAVNVENSIATYGQIYTNNGHITYRVRNPQGSRTYRGQLIFPIT